MSNDEPSTPVVRRRTVIVAGLGAAAVALLGLAWRARQADRESTAVERDPEAVKRALIAFTGALFGRELTAADTSDLSDRIGDLLAAGGMLAHEAAVLARRLDALGAQAGAASFAACAGARRELIVGQIMSLDYKSLRARVLSKLSAERRDWYRVRWSIVPQLAWIYRHSATAWRARGYARSPGEPGDWREITVPGAPYP